MITEAESLFFFFGGGGGGSMLLWFSLDRSLAVSILGMYLIMPNKITVPVTLTGKHSPRTQTHGVQILKVFRF